MEATLMLIVLMIGMICYCNYCNSNDWASSSTMTKATGSSRRVSTTVDGFVPRHHYSIPTQRRQQFVLTGAGLSNPINGQQQQQPTPQNQIALDETNLKEVDMLYGKTTSLVYDPVQERYVEQKYDNRNTFFTTSSSQSASSQKRPNFFRRTILPRLAIAFLPMGVTDNYYRFTKWRIIQRFVSANLNVIGTQSLLLGLGIKAKASHLGALSAALNWVLKDALGKLVRMLWASKMGRRFDSDAKRWRFRASFVFAAGNGLEIITYIFPQFFLLLATLANCFKQISFLTSSSTRTALYNSFRDGTRENIGDITAKGEAQVAIVDLFGIASGVSLSRLVGTSVQSVLSVYFFLQVLELACMYRQLRHVVYRVLNFERMAHVIECFCRRVAQYYDADEVLPMIHMHGSGIPSPHEIAQTERIFLPPPPLLRRHKAYGSLGRARCSPDELQQIMSIFQRERFLLIVGANTKRQQQRNRFQSIRRRIRQQWWYPGRLFKKNKLEGDHAELDRKFRLQENCHIVLHAEATNLDIVKSTLALTLLRHKLEALSDQLDPETVRSSDCMDTLKATMDETETFFPVLRRQMALKGWESPNRFMFGRVHMRAEWPLNINKNNNSASSKSASAATSANTTTALQQQQANAQRNTTGTEPLVPTTKATLVQQQFNETVQQENKTR